jgi:NADH-quinone oxidoreductase subunit E
MSTLSTPEGIMPETTQAGAMDLNLNPTIPAHLQKGATPRVYPFGGFAAASAMQFGMASHAFGLWLGALAGAAEVSQRMMGLGVSWDEADRDDDAVAANPRRAGSQARSAAKTFMADFHNASREIAHATAKVADAVADDVEEASHALLPEDFRRPAAIGRPLAPDDLKLISGIGPKLEKTLNDIGIWTFAQIAGWTTEEIAWVDNFLGFKGRVGRDKWTQQAETLTGDDVEQGALQKASE